VQNFKLTFGVGEANPNFKFQKDETNNFNNRNGIFAFCLQQ
jgi:hypothetical protein